MKSQTRSRLLVSCILLVPLLMILALFVTSKPLVIFIGLLTAFAVCVSLVIVRTLTRSVRGLKDNIRRTAERELGRSRFIMGISHDLKTPLALIRGYAEAIEDGVAEDTVSRSGATEIIIEKTDQLEGMINDLINFVRMETGEWREQLRETNITVFLKNFIKTLSVDIGLLRHEFISDINLPDNLPVPMDEKLAQRALENLINNAVRHTPDGSLIRFAAALNKNAVELTIGDNGPGIDKEALSHIFEMFYRGIPSRREQDMGLGLAVVKWVVEYHGWSISASSEKDQGASFTITIPISS